MRLIHPRPPGGGFRPTAEKLGFPSFTRKEFNGGRKRKANPISGLALRNSRPGYLGMMWHRSSCDMAMSRSWARHISKLSTCLMN